METLQAYFSKKLEKYGLDDFCVQLLIAIMLDSGNFHDSQNIEYSSDFEIIFD